MCWGSNETFTVKQNTRVIDYMPMLCHIQLTPSACTLHYSVSAWKINKYGENPSQFPTFPSESSKFEADHATVTCMPQPSRQVVHRHHSNLAYSIPTPLTRHSCIAKHHLVLFCLQQSQLTKNDNNSCCKTKAKQRGLGGGGKVSLKSSAEKMLHEGRNGKETIQISEVP